MKINFTVSGVKGGSFENDAKETINYGYVYAIGDFRNIDQNGGFNTGLQLQKFKCPDPKVLAAIRGRLVSACEPVSLDLDIEFLAKDGAASVPVVMGVY
jgi:hypothetical protein